jgi:hypothetical protein
LVAVVGSDAAGKSSLVSALCGKPCPARGEAVEEVRVKTQTGVRMHVRDTSETGGLADEAIAWANVILLLYQVDKGDPAAEVDKWMKRLERNSNAPVLLIGTHIDTRLRVVPEGPLAQEEMDALLEQMEDTRMGERVRPLLGKWKRIVGALEVSCTLKINVGYAFSLACSAVCEPRSVLYDEATDAPTKGFAKAIRRMFFLLDKDCDGRLNRDEIAYYQQHVLGLSGEEAQKALTQAVQNLQRNLQYWTMGGATYAGFSESFRDMVAGGASSVVWKALRHFHYNPRLEVVVPTVCEKQLGSVDAKRERLCFTAEALAWLERMHRVARTLGNIKALVSLLPDGTITEDEWPMEDLVSGDVVMVSGSGLSLPSWVALWCLLLEANTVQCAKRVEFMARVLGFDGESPALCCVLSTECGVWSVEYGVWSVECVLCGNCLVCSV